jgi:DNA-binding PadR family transcriptional regulator
MLEMAILGLLKEQPMHGYDLRKRLRTDFGLLSSLSFGSLYPALNRLETEGAVREKDCMPAEPPAEVTALTGSLAGERAAFRARLAVKAAGRTSPPGQRPGGSGTRGRKIYELTPRGEQLFGQLLAQEDQREDGKTFALRWAFAKYLSSEARLRLLARRRRQLEDRLSASRRTAEVPARPLDRFERSLLEHSYQSIQLDLDWIDGLIESERVAQAAGSRATAAAEAEVS